jgi:hypothetical protein
MEVLVDMDDQASRPTRLSASVPFVYLLNPTTTTASTTRTRPHSIPDRPSFLTSPRYTPCRPRRHSALGLARRHHVSSGSYLSVSGDTSIARYQGSRDHHHEPVHVVRTGRRYVPLLESLPRPACLLLSRARALIPRSQVPELHH